MDYFNMELVINGLLMDSNKFAMVIRMTTRPHHPGLQSMAFNTSIREQQQQQVENYIHYIIHKQVYLYIYYIDNIYDIGLKLHKLPINQNPPKSQQKMMTSFFWRNLILLKECD